MRRRPRQTRYRHALVPLRAHPHTTRRCSWGFRCPTIAGRGRTPRRTHRSCATVHMSTRHRASPQTSGTAALHPPRLNERSTAPTRTRPSHVPRVCPASQPAPAPSCVGSSYVGAAGGGGQETSVVLGASTCRFGQHSTTIRPIFSCISAAPSSQPILCTERESTVNKSGVARNTTLRVPRTRPSVLERAAHSTRSIGAHTR